MNKNSGNRQAQSDLNQTSSQQQESNATARKQQQQHQDDPRAETPSGQSKIEAPMSGNKMCGHVHDCDCSTESAIHASELHAPKTIKRSK
ncbi:hypothetical protein EDD11_005930 [Mortierella claussenii]|nr:hypothetical protein EDD11_005930 [Mortierella claussenii]